MALNDLLLGAGAPFTLNATAQQLAPHEPDRALLIIQNTGANPLFLGFGAAANATATAGLTIAAGTIYQPAVVPTDALFGASAAGTTCVVWSP